MMEAEFCFKRNWRGSRDEISRERMRRDWRSLRSERFGEMNDPADGRRFLGGKA